jgi:hypothetical protein
MTKWTAPDIASIRGDNSRPLQKIFGSLTEYLKNTLSQTTEVSQTYVRNGETTTLTTGTVVYLDARQGDRATVKRAYNTSDATSAKTLGVVAENIPAHSDGLVTTLGYLEKVNTSAFTAGQTLYLGATAGTFTATKPYAPNHLVYVGVVVRANAGNGIIYVRCQNGYELDEIHDVQITSPIAGQILSYDSVTDLWKNTSVGNLSSLTVAGNMTVDTDTLHVDSANNRVGVKTTSPTTALDVNGAVTATDFRLGTNFMPRGIVALGTMNSNYTLTTSAVALNAVSWTAVADHYYRVTYFEPEAQTSTVSASTTTLQIRSGATAAGAQLSSGRITTSAAVKVQGAITVSYVTATFAAGTQTVNASALTSSTTGAPVLVRSTTSRAFLMVEDLGSF